MLTRALLALLCVIPLLGGVALSGIAQGEVTPLTDQDMIEIKGGCCCMQETGTRCQAGHEHMEKVECPEAGCGILCVNVNAVCGRTVANLPRHDVCDTSSDPNHSCSLTVGYCTLAIEYKCSQNLRSCDCEQSAEIESGDRNYCGGQNTPPDDMC